MQCGRAVIKTTMHNNVFKNEHKKYKFENENLWLQFIAMSEVKFR